MMTGPNAISLLLISIRKVIRVVTKITIIVHRTAEDVYGSAPVHTSTAVALATVATVIQRR